MSEKRTPNWDDEVIEVINPEPVDEVAYKPSLNKLKKRAVETGNVVPVVNNMQIRGFSKDDIKAVVQDVTITGALRDAMSAPAPTFVAGDKLLNNAQAIGKVLVEKAVSGDMQAIREILNRTEGKVASTNINRNMSVNVKGDANSLMALMNKIDANGGGK